MLRKQKEPLKTEVEYSEEDIAQIREKAVEKIKTSKHTWRQKGAWLVCTSCEYPHGTYIGTHKLLIGVDEENNPIFKDI
jgi:hypothetical protein